MTGRKATNVKQIRPDRVFITLNSEKKELRFTMNALAELEKIYGTMEAVQEELTKGSVNGIRRVLWAALIHDEVKEFDSFGEPISYNISPFSVGNMIELNDLKEVTSALKLALETSMPDQEEPAEDQRKFNEEVKK